MRSKIDNGKLKELLLEYYHGPIKDEGSGFKICCPFHDDHSPSCIVFYGYGTFFCFVCHGDKKKGERGVGIYRGFMALGMPEAKARRLFITGTESIESKSLDMTRLISFDDPVGSEYEPPIKRIDKVIKRTSWPKDWGFRQIEYATINSRWFRKRFEPMRVMLKKERISRIALAIGGAEEFKDTNNPKYLRQEVYLRLSSLVKNKAVNSVGLNLDHKNTRSSIPATLFGLVNNKLSKGSRGLILVEGPYDCIHTYQHIYRPEIGGKFDVVALLGTPQWQHVLEQLRDSIIPEMMRRGIPLILAFDNDAAGLKLTKTAIRDLQMLCYMHESNLKILGYPTTVKDPGDLSFSGFLQCIKELGLIV